MNIPTLMTKIAALMGHPIPVSARPAPFDDTGSIRIPADAGDQIPSRSDLRSIRGVEFARRDGAVAGGGPRPLRLDLLIPKSDGPHPLIVYIPGGGFVRAVRAGGARMRRYVASTGYVVASVEYRTTMHGATYRDGMADVRAAISFLRGHAAEYGIDPDRVAVWGESAGGYLAAMIGVTEELEVNPGEAPILAVVDKFGGSALDRLGEGFDDATVAQIQSPGNSLARYIHGPGARLVTDDLSALREADPATHVSANTPPFLLFHGSADRLISPVGTAALHQALCAADVDSTWYLIDGAGHGDLAVRGGEEKYWTTVPMMTMITDFLDRAVRDRALPER
ncbi:alpha/beta hydrolase [Microbacterium sp. 2FI]|uniref:alpha/beta hydrolase n=1 Tax=Microbacterium sp. 2FI TaxID=2502193 RepID=UPI0010F4811E|nr:alpha/beta hydrolase [Microbacterium sp. 2FI]